ncbi:hypothetical protein PLICRDRAFT_99865 [Plicaturopsis crispa FD-325 SS-3]|nr:hypothetical protein PLICRDRAFT_99865 [Plicaturopsis crispa FD-325 SS-3]
MDPLTTSQPTLADLLTIESSASIFFSYARETQLSALFSQEGARNTVLVPTNKAVMALARKPHQGPERGGLESGIEISEQEFDEKSKRNVENWVSAHIIPISPIKIADTSYRTMLDGKSVAVKLEGREEDGKPDWSRAVIDGNVHIIGKREGLNGVLYLVDETIKYE